MKVVNQESTDFFSTFQLKMKNIKLVNTMKVYPFRSRIFLNPGISNGFRFGTEVKYLGGSALPGDYKSGYEIGVVAGIGTQLFSSRLIVGTLEFRYELEWDLTSETFVGSRNLGIILSIQF